MSKKDRILEEIMPRISNFEEKTSIYKFKQLNKPQVRQIQRDLDLDSI